ncbi:mediator of RNA polymerase II transcription subunit 15a [Trifolium repens]|nr:mediator of RNA polymerase II transcription subunit 15a [Trifolium repens]
MDPKNWRLNQDNEPAIDTTDWRAQLLPDSRQQIINKLLDVLKKHLPVNGSEGLLELQKIAQRFEDKIFTAATDQSDYLRKISLKMLTMDNKSHNTIASNTLSNEVGPRNKLLGEGNCGMAPISVIERNAIRNQKKTGLKSTSKTIPAEVRPSSSMDPLGQEKEYSSTQPDHFKRKKVSLGNPSYSSERTAPGAPKSPLATTVIHNHDNLFLQSEVLNFAGPTEPSKVVSLGLEKIFDVVATNAMWLNSVANEAKDVFKTWPSEKLKYEEELQRLTDQQKEKNELIAQLKEDNFKLATKSKGEKAELSAQLESSKKACENANTLLKDAQQTPEEVRKKHSIN